MPMSPYVNKDPRWLKSKEPQAPLQRRQRTGAAEGAGLSVLGDGRLARLGRLCLPCREQPMSGT